MAEPLVEQVVEVSEQAELQELIIMKLAIAPPKRVAAGVALNAPLVVTFDTSKLRGRRDRHQEETLEMSGFWAFLSLVSEDCGHSLAPPDKDLPPSQPLLLGKKMDSVHIVPPGAQQEREDLFAYASFPNVAVTARGRFCLMVSIIDCNRCVMSHMNQRILKEDQRGGQSNTCPPFRRIRRY